MKGTRKGKQARNNPPNTKKTVTLSHHKSILSHHTFLVAVKLAAIQVMDRYRDNCICLTGLVRTGFFLLGCFFQCGTYLDNLEALQNDVVEKVAPTSQPIPASVMIKSTNNV